MGLTDSKFDLWCQDKLKIKGWVAIVLLVVIVIAVIALAIGIGFIIKKKTKSSESYTPAAANLKSQIQQYVSVWNDTVDSYHGIKKEGYKIRKPAEKYERSRTANNFSYLRSNTE